MTRLIAAVGITATIVAGVAGQTPKYDVIPKYDVKVTAEKNVDFSTVMRYTWTKGQPSSDKRVDAAVIAAVDRELSVLGMKPTASGPGDVMVTYYSVSRTDVNVKAKPGPNGLPPSYLVGTLVVALLDPETRRPLLKLRIDKPIDIEPAALDAGISSAVTALFAKYPTRKTR